MYGRILPLLLLLLLMLTSTIPLALATSSDRVKIGVLAFQPKSVTAQKWSVLGDYLETQISGAGFDIVPMSNTELERTIANGQIDFVLTNPSQYTFFRHVYGLSAPLATVIRGTDDMPLNAFGGAIFTLTDRTDINDLEDIHDKRIAVPFKTAFGAYQMQQYELFLKNLSLIKEHQLVVTGLPHDNMVSAVLNGDADLGFARAGTLERMAAQGRIDLSQFKVINLQKLFSFPAMVSTHLYPEWPFAAMPHIEPARQKKIVAALLVMDQAGSGKMPFNVQGFLPPANYDSVENLMRTLRVPPFDHVPAVRASDIWQIYHDEIILIGLALTVIALLGVYLINSRRQLHLTKERLDLAIKGAQAGLWDWYVQTGKTIFNERWAEIVGYTLDELAPVSIRTWTDLCHPEDLEKSKDLIEKHFAGETGFYQCEARMKHKDGSWVWVLDQGKVVEWDSKGKPFRVTGTSVDITERKRIDTMLQTEHDIGSGWSSAGTFNERLKLCLRTAIRVSSMDCGGLYLVDETDGSIQLIVHQGLPDTFIVQTGYFAADSNQARLIQKGQPVYARYQDLVRKRNDATASEGLKAIAVVPVLFQGRAVACLNVASHVLNHVPEHARSALESVAHYTRSFIAHEVQEEKSRQNRQNLETLFNTIEDMLFVLDMEGHIIQHNRMVGDRLEYADNELIGKHLLAVHPEDRHQEAQDMIAAILAGESETCLIPLKTSNGEFIPVETKVKLGRWQDRDVIFGISRDITERLEIERRKQQIEKTESLARMAGAVAHHFNNMLGAVICYLEMAMKGLPPGTVLANNIDRANQAAQRAAKTSEHMLVFLGRGLTQSEPIDLAATCKQHADQLRNTIPENVSLKTDMSTPGLIVNADHDWIGKVLTHLVTNAWEAMDDLPGEVRITVGAVDAARIPKRNRFPMEWTHSAVEYGCLSVTDTGHGMDADVVGRIFDPFYTDKFPGRGMGLAISLGTVKSFGGCITVDSELGSGSIFRIFLPLSSQSAAG